MTSEHFRRVESLFHAAITQPENARASFLQSHETDPRVREEVLRLLRHVQDAGPGPLETRLQDVGGLVDPAPAQVGPYRILRVLGEGGMGRVLLAERDVDGTPRRVALKLLHGVPGDTARRRLARERELLAGLHHPHIAGLVDSGLSDDGRPYLVMDYVEGEPLSDYLARHRPGLAERLRLYLQCCDAVQHAHQRLVLHRDIKPANILVSEDGTPVLLDFGVGRPLGEEAGERTVTLAFTPGYAAPEQIRGEPATTATDVFGLGALLFDLLADTRLYAVRKGEAAVPAPSRYVADAALRHAVRGDLDRIVLKATAQAPEARYPAATALAEDVRRYLRGEPLSAGPDALGYRLRKFVGRHRVAVAAGVAALLMAGAFVWRLDAERQRALQAEAQAERETLGAKASRDFLVSVLGAANPEELQGRSLTLDALLDAATARLRADRELEPHARMLSWLTIAEIYGNVRHPQQVLSAVREAEAAYRQAGEDADARARILELRGSALRDMERHGEALAQMRALVALREKRPNPLAQAQAHHAYATAAVDAREFALADAQFRLALSLMDRAEVPREDRRRLGVLLNMLTLEISRANFDAADRFLGRILPIAKRVLRPDDLDWGRIHNAASEIRLNQTRYLEALREAELAMAGIRRAYGERTVRLVWQDKRIASILYQLGREQEAIAHLRAARELGAALRVGGVPLAQLDVELATNQISWGQHREAIRVLDGALAQLPADDPAQELWLMAAHGLRARAHAALGDYPRAWPDFEQEQRLALRIGADSFEYAQALLPYAQALLEAGRLRESARALAVAKRINQAQGIDERTPAGIAQLMLEARLRQASGDPAAASRDVDRALCAIQARGAEIDPKNAAALRVAAARIAFAQRDRSRARQLLDQALPVMERRLWPQAVQLAKARELQRQLGPGLAAR
ncbi:serine/threonine-protein kinase [Luteimonas aquatica]|uniref:serine/threonine-protein kinase n=1 Tax=Luteimonas aquatica TaxID=450364 RepID=UPI001F59E1F3|nr:serine/threonine-protein kinase [Luteimonas aquatica]